MGVEPTSPGRHPALYQLSYLPIGVLPVAAPKSLADHGTPEKCPAADGDQATGWTSPPLVTRRGRVVFGKLDLALGTQA